MDKEPAPTKVIKTPSIDIITSTSGILTAPNEINAVIINRYLWSDLKSLDSTVDEVLLYYNLGYTPAPKRRTYTPKGILEERIYFLRNQEINLVKRRFLNLLSLNKEFSAIITKNPYIGSAIRFYLNKVNQRKHSIIDKVSDNATSINEWFLKQINSSQGERSKLMRSELLLLYHFAQQKKSKSALQWLYNINSYTQVLHLPLTINTKCAIARAFEKVGCRTTLEMAFQSGQCPLCILKNGDYLHTKASFELVCIALEQGANPNEIMKIRHCGHRIDSDGFLKFQHYQLQMPLTHVEDFLNDKKEKKIWLTHAIKDAEEKKIEFEQSDYYKQYQNQIKEYTKIKEMLERRNAKKSLSTAAIVQFRNIFS